MWKRLAAAYFKTLTQLDGQRKTVQAIVRIYPGRESRSACVPGAFISDASLSTKRSRVSKSRPSFDCLSLSEIPLPSPLLQQASSCQLSQSISHSKETFIMLSGDVRLFAFLSPSLPLLFLLSSYSNSFVTIIWIEYKILRLKAPLLEEDNKQF
jgi:hypothetical protein